MNQPLTPDQLSCVANLLGQLANWQSRTFTRPEPYGAQAGEDAMIAELFPEPIGCYVDVGAGDPISCSNTFRLWERGWRGLLIEPRKDAVFDLCARRPGDYVYPVAASNQDGWSRMRIQGSVSSMQADWNIDEQTKSFCQTETLRSILARFPAIRDTCQLCSIDVEGHERQVLEGIDWDTFHPKAFVIEYVIYGVAAPQSDISAQWEPILLQRGYHLWRTTSLNKIYLKT
jgi:FkbM family methyltransferase